MRIRESRGTQGGLPVEASRAGDVREQTREIDITENEVLEANLRALGIDASIARQQGTTKQRVYEASIALVKELGRIPTAVEIAQRVGVTSRAVQNSLGDLAQDGRMIRVPHGKRILFVPRVV